MGKIKLYIFDIELGFLVSNNDSYNFHQNTENITKAKNQYPRQMRALKLCEQGNTVFDNIPFPYSDFLMYSSRSDLASEAGIVEGDSDFEKVYKLSKLDMITPVYSIKCD